MIIHFQIQACMHMVSELSRISMGYRKWGAMLLIREQQMMTEINLVLPGKNYGWPNEECNSNGENTGLCFVLIHL